MQENGLDQDAEGPEIGSEELEPHPACAAMPAMPWDVTRGLVEDIEANGLLEPIVIHGGQVLDGWHRLEACRKADVEPRFRRWDGECGTPER